MSTGVDPRDMVASPSRLYATESALAGSGDDERVNAHDMQCRRILALRQEITSLKTAICDLRCSDNGSDDVNPVLKSYVVNLHIVQTELKKLVTAEALLFAQLSGSPLPTRHVTSDPLKPTAPRPGSPPMERTVNFAGDDLHALRARAFALRGVKRLDAAREEELRRVLVRIGVARMAAPSLFVCVFPSRQRRIRILEESRRTGAV